MLTNQAPRGIHIVTMYDGSLGASAVTSVREHVASERAGVRMLLDVRDLRGIEPKAAWTELTSTELLNDVDRAAVIAGSTILQGSTATAANLTSTDVKTCEPGQRDQALRWLQS